MAWSYLCLPLPLQAVELASKTKEFMAATSKKEQLESLLEKAEGSQAASTDLHKQVLVLLGVRVVFWSHSCWSMSTAFGTWLASQRCTSDLIQSTCIGFSSFFPMSSLGACF